jgi:hypothetical protein
MKRTTTILTLAATLGLAAPVLADTMPAGVLLETCNRTDEASVAVCSAYFMGVIEGMAMERRAVDSSRPVCTTRLTPIQLKAEFVTYANAHKPSDRADAHDLVLNVLFDQHICPAHGN